MIPLSQDARRCGREQPKERRSRRLCVTRIFPRRQRGPRRRDLAKRHKYWLRADEVPTARVEVDPASASQFDRFNAFRGQLAPGRRLPVELDVLLRRDGPGKISVWMLPTDVLEATLIGCLSDAAVSAYEAVLDRLSRDQAPIAMFTAHQEGPGRYAAVVEGRPRDWDIPQT